MMMMVSIQTFRQIFSFKIIAIQVTVVKYKLNLEHVLDALIAVDKQFALLLSKHLHFIINLKSSKDVF